MDNQSYSPRNRAERVISAWRVFLAVMLTIATVLDSQPRRLGITGYSLALGYLSYAIGVAAITWRRRVTTRSVPIVTQVVDLGIFSAFIFLTRGTDTPFFPYFLFAIICGAIRWHGRGALITGGAALVAYILATVSAVRLEPLEEFNIPGFIARCTQLALVGGLLAYLGTFQFRLQRELTSLAAWPRRLPTERTAAVEEVLAYASRVIGARSLVLVWEEGDEPSLHVAEHDGRAFVLSREAPNAFGTIVSESLERSSFACTRLDTPHPRVLQRTPGGFRFRNMDALDPRFRERYRISSAVGLRLSTESIQGWLFALDKPNAGQEDVLLGDIVGRLVADALELQTLVEQLRESAVGEERVRLARELHDGVLQSLTAASLQAQRARQAIATSAPDAERRLALIEQTILAEQQALRLAIEDLKPGSMRDETPVDVIPRLRDIATRVAGQWDVRAHLNLQRDVPPVPQKTAHELTRMVQEAVVNAIRHGGAKEVTITCIVMGTDLALAVSYHGRGFSGFVGRQDLASLNEMKAGPRTLKERVNAIGGEMVIDSGETGARVEIRVPLTPTR